MIAEGHKANLKTIELAAENQDLALIECQRVSDGKVVVMLAAISEPYDPETGEYAITPFAEMVDGDPYKLYRAPKPGGGYYEPED